MSVTEEDKKEARKLMDLIIQNGIYHDTLTAELQEISFQNTEINRIKDEKQRYDARINLNNELLALHVKIAKAFIERTENLQSLILKYRKYVPQLLNHDA